MNKAEDFLKSINSHCVTDDCLELFKHMILGKYLFKKNIEVYSDSDFEITPELDKKIANILKTYLSNSIEINGKIIKYDKFNHFDISSIGIIVIKDDKDKDDKHPEVKKNHAAVMDELKSLAKNRTHGK